MTSRPRVEAYWNLHKDCVSYRSSGGRIQHAEIVELADVALAVQPAGNAKVRRDRRKTVHAYVRGRLVATGSLIPGDAIEVTYNPYLNDTFVRVDTGQPVIHAERAWIAHKRVWLPRV